MSDHDMSNRPAPARRPRGRGMARAVVDLARSLPGWESSPLNPDTPFLPRRSAEHDLDLTVPLAAQAVDEDAEALRQGLLDGIVSVAESVAARPQWRELAELAGLDPDDDTRTAVPDLSDEASDDYVDEDADQDVDGDEVGWP